MSKLLSRCFFCTSSFSLNHRSSESRKAIYFPEAMLIPFISSSRYTAIVFKLIS